MKFLQALTVTSCLLAASAASAANTLQSFVSQLNSLDDVAVNGENPLFVKLQTTNTGYSGQNRVYRGPGNPTGPAGPSGNGQYGGEFRVLWNGDNSGDHNAGSFDTIGLESLGNHASVDIFKTFCAELNEHFSPNRTYAVTLDDQAKYGASQAPNDQAKLLFALYMSGKLEAATGGLFQYEDQTSSGALQDSLWRFSGYTPSSLSSNESQALQNWAADNVGNYDLNGEVKILNLWNVNLTSGAVDYSKGAQSQFIYLPDGNGGPSPVPEPTTFAIWGMGLAGLGYARYRRRKKA